MGTRLEGTGCDYLMINFKDFTCGSNPEELFDSLRLGFSVYLMPCKNCNKTLINIKSEVNASEAGHEIVAYFKCDCGKKYRKVVLDLYNSGYKCRQGLIHKQVQKLRRKEASPTGPSKYYITFHDDDMNPVYYEVTKENVQFKKGAPKNV